MPYEDTPCCTVSLVQKGAKPWTMPFMKKTEQEKAATFLGKVRILSMVSLP